MARLSLDTLTQTDIKRALNTNSFRRAKRYLSRISRPIRKGDTLTAQVRGTYVYEVEVQVKESGIAAICDCPYDWGGHCKHIGAVLLKWLNEPGAFLGQVAAPKTEDSPLNVTRVEPLAATQPEEEPAWITASFKARQQATIQHLDTALNELKLQKLRTMAKKHKWVVKGTRKAEVTRQISERLLNGNQLETIYANLAPEYKQVLRTIVIWSNTKTLTTETLAKIAKTWGPLTQHANLTTYFKHLTDFGLLLPETINAYQRTEAVPPAITQRLPPVLAEVVPATKSPPAGHDLRYGNPDHLPQAISQLLLMVEQSPVAMRPPQPRPTIERFYPGLKAWKYDPEEVCRLEEAGQLKGYQQISLRVPAPNYPLPDDAMAHLSPIVGGEDELEFAYNLMVAAGLLYPGSPLTPWPSIKEQFFRLSPVVQRATLTRIYFGMAGWSELWAVLRHASTTPANQRITLRRNWMSANYFQIDDFLLHLLAFKQVGLRLLASLPSDHWISWADLTQMLPGVWPQFDGSIWHTHYYGYPQRMPVWFLAKETQETPLATDNSENCQLAQGRYLQRMITGPLHWLGLADLSFDGSELVAFQLHNLADLYWDRLEAPAPPAHIPVQTTAQSLSESLTIDEQTIIVNPAAVGAQGHSLLDHIARLEVTTPEQFIYRLNGEAAHQAFEAGLTLTEIETSWQQVFGQPVPEQIQAQLSVWWQAYGQVRIYEDVTIIEFSDDHALREMKAVTSLEKHLLTEISPRLVLIPLKAVEILAGELEKAGYTPKVTTSVDG